MLRGLARLASALPLAVPLFLAACGEAAGAGSSSVLKIVGSTTVNPVVAEAAEVLREERGLGILVDTQGGSSGGIAALGEGRAQVGMSSKPLTDEARRRYPGTDFVVHRVGVDAVALVVSADVWEAGVRALSRDQVRAIYEGRITRWSELGGDDRRIAFFNKEPGRGTWEVFATWLYGSADAAPAVAFPEVGGNEETRSKIGGTPGALGQLSASWADGERVFALALEQDGEPVEPTPDNLASGRYAMSRPLLLLTDGPAQGAAKSLVEFVLSPRGQELVRKHGYLDLETLGG